MNGFLKEYYEECPISVRIQKKDESIMEARSLLINASKKKKCKLALLIRTNLDFAYQEMLIDSEEDIEILIVDSYELSIKEYIENKLKY